MSEALRGQSLQFNAVLYPQEGPGWFHRRQLMMNSSTAALTSIVSFDAQRIVIPEVEIKLDRCQENGVRMLLAMPDDELLQLTSTSPEHEDQGYARGASLTDLT